MGSADFAELERAMCRLPEISAARVVVDTNSQPVEIHVLASAAKHVKQIVRDVQSLAMASFGLTLDRRIISVVQLSAPNGHTEQPVSGSSERTDQDPGAAPPSEPGSNGARDDPVAAHRADDPAVPAGPSRRANEPPVMLDGIQLTQAGERSWVQVTLRSRRQRSSGSASGLGTGTASVRLVAAATITALEDLRPTARQADLEAATVVRVGERRVALVTLVLLLGRGEQVVSGSAVVREAGDLDAVVRAVLDATNRPLSTPR